MIKFKNSLYLISVLALSIALTACSEKTLPQNETGNTTVTEAESTTVSNSTEEFIREETGDYPPVTVEGFEVSADDFLTLTLHNRMNYDLGYIPNLRLYHNGELVEYTGQVGFCGVPDTFTADSEKRFEFDLNYYYPNTLNGSYTFEYDFKNYEDFHTSDEVFTVRGEIEVNNLNFVQTEQAECELCIFIEAENQDNQFNF